EDEARARAASTLPPDLLAEGARRLGTLSLLISAVMIGTFVIMIWLSLTPGTAVRLSGAVFWTGIGRIAIAVGLFLVSRLKNLDASSFLNTGLVFEVLMGLLISIAYHSEPHQIVLFPPAFSPVAVWLLVYGLIVPSTRGKTILATVSTALMDPLGLLVE